MFHPSSEHFAELKRLLSELGSPEVCCHIQDWDKGGKVFLDYITMIETLEQLKQAGFKKNPCKRVDFAACYDSGLSCYILIGLPRI